MWGRDLLDKLSKKNMKIRVKEHKNRHQFLIVEKKVAKWGDDEAHKTNCMNGKWEKIV